MITQIQKYSNTQTHFWQVSHRIAVYLINLLQFYCNTTRKKTIRMNPQIHKYIGTNTLLTIITTTLIIIEPRGNMCRKEKCAEHKNVPVEEMCRAPPSARNLQSHSAQDHPLSLSALCWTWMCTSPCHVIPLPYHHTIPCHASPIPYHQYQYHTMPHHTIPYHVSAVHIVSSWSPVSS